MDVNSDGSCCQINRVNSVEQAKSISDLEAHNPRLKKKAKVNLCITWHCNTGEKAAGKPQILICNRCYINVITNSIYFAMQYNVIPFIIPIHILLLTQLLNISMYCLLITFSSWAV